MHARSPCASAHAPPLTPPAGQIYELLAGHSRGRAAAGKVHTRVQWIDAFVSENIRGAHFDESGSMILDENEAPAPYERHLQCRAGPMSQPDWIDDTSENQFDVHGVITRDPSSGFEQ